MKIQNIWEENLSKLIELTDKVTNGEVDRQQAAVAFVGHGLIGQALNQYVKMQALAALKGVSNENPFMIEDKTQ